MPIEERTTEEKVKKLINKVAILEKRVEQLEEQKKTLNETAAKWLDKDGYYED